ncbi:MAG: glycerol-3-phosphate dehydrogenase/oxidase [Armatimonadetes bacterium]|nr:glycerol-3-phosphate dehydrogenase/oxidase [Armatimonadota bacterium]
MDTYDLLVIGGGINGVALAREAARRGWTVFLAEQDDYGSGTRAASSRLIHGGLRYLQYGELGLVRESLRERARFLRERPHAVRPLHLYLPHYTHAPQPAWMIRLGLWLYDRLAGGEGNLPRHEALTSAALAEREPALNPQGLRGGFAYADAQVVFPERLCLELLLEARTAGAITRNYTRVVALSLAGHMGIEAGLEDVLTGEQTTICARVAVNAAGPWVDRVLGLLPRHGPELIGGSRGSHLLLPRRANGPTQALYVTARRDGRPFFILPWREWLLVGTTEVRHRGDPGVARATPEEVEYLLNELRWLFPRAGYGVADVLLTYAGVRPLPARPGPAGRVSRRHFLTDQGRDRDFPNLFSIVGGKWTTCLRLAEEVVERLAPRLGRSGPAAPPALPPPPPGTSSLRAAGLEAEDAGYFYALYGARLPALLDRLRADPSGRERLCPTHRDVAAQVDLAIAEEEARTLADVLLRRTGLGTGDCLGLDCAPVVVARMGRLLGWDAQRQAAAVLAYRNLVRQRFRAGLE